MDAVFGVTHNIFTNQFQQSDLETLSNRALSNGIGLYIKKDYEGAAKEFKRSVGLAPNGPNSAKAGDYLAQAYLKLDKTEKAISAYKTAAELNPQRDDIPSTEVTIAQFPDSVAYDPLSQTATVTFTIRQNAEADGTIDPSHIVFKFVGKDQDGYTIDPHADEFTGFSGVA